MRNKLDDIYAQIKGIANGSIGCNDAELESLAFNIESYFAENNRQSTIQVPDRDGPLELKLFCGRVRIMIGDLFSTYLSEPHIPVDHMKEIVEKYNAAIKQKSRYRTRFKLSWGAKLKGEIKNMKPRLKWMDTGKCPNCNNDIYQNIDNEGHTDHAFCHKCKWEWGGVAENQLETDVNAQMTWTKERPRQPGWWWLSNKVKKDRVIVQIVELSNIDPNYRIGVKFIDCKFQYIDSKYFDDCWWIGPIPEPMQ